MVKTGLLRPEVLRNGDFGTAARSGLCWLLASRWPRFVEPSLGLGSGHCLVGTLVNTKGLAALL